MLHFFVLAALAASSPRPALLCEDELELTYTPAALVAPADRTPPVAPPMCLPGVDSSDPACRVLPPLRAPSRGVSMDLLQLRAVLSAARLDGPASRRLAFERPRTTPLAPGFQSRVDRPPESAC